MGLTSTTATRLIGPIYAPDGSVLYDPTTDGALTNASKLSAYPLVIGTDVPHDTAAGVGAVANAGAVVSMLAGTLANRPAAGTAGRFYFATDQQAWSYDTGSAWQNITVVAVQGTIGGSPTLSAGWLFSETLGTDWNINGATTFTPPNGAASGTFFGWNQSAGSRDSDIICVTGSDTTSLALAVFWASGTAAPFTLTRILTLDTEGNLVANTFTSTVATGTAPLVVASTTLNENLNAELWGGAENDIAEIAATGGYTTTSSTHVSTGQGGSFTPTSTKVEIVSSADIYNETAGELAQVGIYRNTSGVPSAGTSVGSDTLVASASMVSGTASADATVALVGLDTGLTAGTTYYYYWAIWVESSGTVGLQTLQGESLQTTRMLLRST